MSSISSIGGSLISGVSNLIGGQQQQSSAQSSVNQQEAYQSNEADTTFQRTTADMKAAGLNPMLAYQEQDPSPTGGSISTSNILGNAMNAGISNYSALQSARQTDPQIASTSASTDLTKASIPNAAAQANLTQALTAKAAADTTSALSSSKVANAQADKITSGSLMSDVIGSNAAAKTSQYLNSAMDSVTNKISDLITQVRSNSASALHMMNKPASATANAIHRGLDAISDVPPVNLPTQ
jgi:hypothetical protein